MDDFALFTDVILAEDFPDEKLSAGDVGTVVEHHSMSSGPAACSAEFFDMTGRTVAVITVAADKLRAPTSADRPTVRVLTPPGS